MRLFRVLSAAVLLALLATFLALPVHAADLPWDAGTEEFEITAAFSHDADAGTLGDVSFGWLHNVTPRTQFGTTLNVLIGNQDGYAAGPLYRFHFLPIGCAGDGTHCKGNLFLTGSLAAMSGGLSDEAAAAAATGMGVQVYVGKLCALNVSGNVSRAIQPGPEGANGGNAFDRRVLLVGLSFAHPPPITN